MKSEPRLESLLQRLDRHPAWLLPIYISVYFAAVVPVALRPLWYDELFTYYVSISGNAHEFFGRVFHVDLNPPLGYLLVALSMRVVGDSPFAVRLPSVMAFLLASLVVYVFARKRLGGLHGLTAMVLMWSCGFLDLATQARPYALMLAFFALAFLFWTKVGRNSAFNFNHWALSGSLAAMFLSHCFAVFLIPPFLMGELTRGFHGKTFSRPSWIALLLPTPLVLTYIPLLGRAESMLFPPAFLPSFHRAGLFYLSLFLSLGPLVALPLLVLLTARTRVGSRFLLSRGENVCIASTLLMPLLIMVYLGLVHVAFWPRYGIGVTLAWSVGTVFMLAWKSNCNIFVSSIAAALTLTGFCIQVFPTLATHWKPQPTSTVYLQIHPELSFVTASGLAFLEMDHRESPEFAHRLYYLTDRTAAIRYAHATIFEALPSVCKYFPVRAHVMPYQKFVEGHHRFLVFATPHFPEDWLLEKLKDDGAVIRQIADMKTSYRDTALYEVRFPDSVR